MSIQKMVLTLSLLALSGCLLTRNEVSEEQRMQSQVSQLQKTKADQEANIQSFDERVRAMSGRLETLEHRVEILTQEKDGLKNQLASAENRFKELEQAILQVEHTSSAPRPREEEKVENSREKKRTAFDEAEEFYSQKQWKKAIAFYQKFRDKNPSGLEFGLATLKIGQCFQELKMFKEARVFYEEVVEKYPKSKLAKTATTKLNQIKKK
ncbi:MAG: tetratricopeptide repeat protein [Bdellovibrionales bacterium]